MKKYKFSVMFHPSEHRSFQLVDVHNHVSSDLPGDRDEMWLEVGRKELASVVISPEEAIEIAKALYKAAYALGYENPNKKN